MPKEIHPLQQMSTIERLNLDIEFLHLSNTMQLTTKLQPKEYEFAEKMFTEAYAIGFKNGKLAQQNPEQFV